MKLKEKTLKALKQTMAAALLGLLAPGAYSAQGLPEVDSIQGGAVENPPAQQFSRFHYDERSGQCLDSRAQTGYNPIPDPREMFKNPVLDEVSNATYSDFDAECVDFSGFDFNKHIGLSYPQLLRWNFRGAKFANSKFYFAGMTDADLRGADLQNFKIGYTVIVGTVDSFTQGIDGCKKEERNQITCAV